ncbi:hypothetical protein PVAND_000835 [Polypedilum vanderplanki]|uniref:Transmembrane protein 179 n=1 Tax=Polypedilum vanderplanki TaxID=319348 RepID=A0A9J6BLR5_POLVA|nr:hypothetical protein PVAND_000835 [Polypedilum vanderplanki]
MTLSHKILLGQISLHVFAIILCLCLTIPLAINQIRFDGYCLLFSVGNWREDDGLLDISWSSKFYCVFPTFSGCLILILSGLQIYRLTMLYRKEEESSFLALFVDSFVSIICCTMVLASAIFITLGFIVWCGLMNERFPSCETADGQNITKSEVKIRTNGFYNEIGLAQFGAWATFAVFAVLSTFAILKLINNHQLRNLRVSMYLERQRLVNEENFLGNFSEPVSRQENMD